MSTGKAGTTTSGQHLGGPAPSKVQGSRRESWLLSHRGATLRQCRCQQPDASRDGRVLRARLRHERTRRYETLPVGPARRDHGWRLELPVLRLPSLAINASVSSSSSSRQADRPFWVAGRCCAFVVYAQRRHGLGAGPGRDEA